MEINKTINKAEATAIFQQNAYLCGRYDVIPEYRVLELLGGELAAWIDKCAVHDGYLTSGTDYNAWGSGKHFIRLFYLCGFFKCVSEHNDILAQAAHEQSPMGKLSDAAWDARGRRLAEADAAAAQRAKRKPRNRKTAEQKNNG